MRLLQLYIKFLETLGPDSPVMGLLYPHFKFLELSGPRQVCNGTAILIP